MEKFEPKVPETIGKQECIKFAEEIKETILKTFPFISEDEKNTFLQKFDEILRDEEILSNFDLLPKHIRLALKVLNDTHTVLMEKDNMQRYRLENPIYYKAGKFWVDSENGTAEVVSLNNIPVSDLIEKERKEINGGTDDWQIAMALQEISVSENETSAVLGLRGADGEEEVVEVKFTDRSKNRKFVEGKILPGNIGYINIESWSNQIKREGKNIGDIIEEELEKIKGSNSLIIDIRQNGGGDSSFAERLAKQFIDRPAQFATCLKRVSGKDQLDEKKFDIKPEGKPSDKKIVILTSSKCISSSELFVLMLKDTGKTITIGQATGGGSGCPKSFDLHLGNRDFKLNVSTWKIIRNNGQKLQNVGIEPDIAVETTPDDVIKHRDVELEKAIKYLKQ